jgi:hypothetical protein
MLLLALLDKALVMIDNADCITSYLQLYSGLFSDVRY